MCKVPHSTSFKSIFALGCKQRATNWVQINFPTKRHPPNVILTLTLIKRPPPAHQGALFRPLALFFFKKAFMRTNLWKCRSCWRTKRHKVTAGSAENGSQETAAWQPSPATSCLSSALQQLYSVLQQPLSWPTAQRLWPGVTGHRSTRTPPLITTPRVYCRWRYPHGAVTGRR